MTDAETPSGRIQFTLSMRQRRLRVLTLVILAFIVLMIVYGMTSPFFHLHPPALLSHHLRRAFALRAMFILGYWTVCILLACSLFFIAWLDIRELRLQTLMARRDMWRDIANRSREQAARRPHRN